MNVFARELSDDLASLVKKLDETLGKNQEKQLSGWVVLLTEDPDADEAKVAAFAEKHGIKNLPLTIFEGSAGPPNYKIAKEADVTVMMWVKTEVKANHALAKGELKPEKIDAIVADTSKILN